MIATRIRNMRLAPKLVLSFLLLILIMTAFFLYLYSAAMNRMEEMALSASEHMQQQIQDKVEQRIGEFRQMTAYCQNDQGFAWLMNRKRPIDGETIYQMDFQKKHLPNIAISNSEVFGYYFYSALSGYAFSNTRISMRIPLYYDRMFMLEGMDYEEWKTMLETPHTGVILLQAQQIYWDSAREVCIPCLVPVVDGNMKYVGCSVFFLRERAVSSLFVTQSEPRIAYFCLRDAEGKLITESGDRAVLNDPGQILTLESRSGLGFTCVSVIQKHELSNVLQTVRRRLYFGIASVLLLSLLLSVLLARQNTSQLKAVLRRVEKMGYPVEHENEIRQLDGVIRMQYSANERYARELREKNEWARYVLFERLLDGRAADAHMLSELEQQLPCAECACVYLEIRTADEELWSARQALEGYLREAREQIPFFRSLSETRYQAVWRGESVQQGEKTFRGIAEKFAAENRRVICFIGPAAESIRDLPLSSRNVQYRMMLQDADEGNSVILCGRAPESDAETMYTIEMDKQFTQHCLQGNEPEAMALLEQVRRESGRRGIAPRMASQLLISGLSKTILTVMGKLPGDFAETEWVLNGVEDIQRRQSLEDLFSFAEKCAALFCRHAAAAKGAHAAQKLKEIEDYLRDRFADPEMRLGMIADRFGMDERYLSDFYKKNTGVNLSTHIEELRTARARELLRGGTPVNDTALRVGYENVNTFRRAYRRQWGINPSDEAQNENREEKQP